MLSPPETLSAGNLPCFGEKLPCGGLCCEGASAESLPAAARHVTPLSVAPRQAAFPKIRKCSVAPHLIQPFLVLLYHTPKLAGKLYISCFSRASLTDCRQKKGTFQSFFFFYNSFLSLPRSLPPSSPGIFYESCLLVL